MVGITWKIKILLLISCLFVTLAKAQDETVDEHSQDETTQPEVEEESTEPEVQDETTQPEVQDEEPTEPPAEEEHPDSRDQDEERNIQINDDHTEEQVEEETTEAQWHEETTTQRQVQHSTTPAPRRGIIGMLKELVKNILRRAIGLQNNSEHDLDANLTEQANYMLQGMASYKFMNNDSMSGKGGCGEGFEDFTVLKSVADKTMKDCIQAAKTEHLECALQDLRDFIDERAKLSNLLDDTDLECRFRPPTAYSSDCTEASNLIEDAERTQEAYNYVKEHMDLATKRVEFETKNCFRKESANLEKNAAKVQHYFATCQNGEESNRAEESNHNEPRSEERSSGNELVTVAQKLMRLKETVVGVLREFVSRKEQDPEVEFDKIIEDNLQKNLAVRYEKAQQYIEGARRQGLNVHDCVAKNEEMYQNITRVANKLLSACSKDSAKTVYSGVHQDYEHIILKCKNTLAVLNRLMDVCSYPEKQTNSNCGESELPGLLSIVRELHQRYWDVQNEKSNYMTTGQKTMDDCLEDRMPLIKWEASNMENDAWQCVHVVYSLDQGRTR